MKTSTEIGSTAAFTGMEKAVELVAKAGFDCWDFSLFGMATYSWSKRERMYVGDPLEQRDTALKLAQTLRKTGESLGITCNQSHAPFPVSCEPIRECLPLALECTAEAGGKICVIHPDNNKNAAENAAMYKELLPYAHEYGVMIATENMWNWDNETDQATSAACSDGKSFTEHIDIVNDPFLVACVDVGHAEMKGLGTTAADMIKELGHRVKALHLHDNDKWHDDHALPFTKKIDYAPVICALKQIGYAGEFTLETNLAKVERTDVFDGLKKMSQAAKRLAEMFCS